MDVTILLKLTVERSDGPTITTQSARLLIAEAVSELLDGTDLDVEAEGKNDVTVYAVDAVDVTVVA